MLGTSTEPTLHQAAAKLESRPRDAFEGKLLDYFHHKLEDEKNHGPWLLGLIEFQWDVPDRRLTGTRSNLIQVRRDLHEEFDRLSAPDLRDQ